MLAAAVQRRWRRGRIWRGLTGLALALGLLAVSGSSQAFVHVVRPNESVAQIAERVYGRVELERLVVHVNGLDGRRGAGLVPGMRLELPALGHYKVLPGDRWQKIAEELLGDPKRGDLLSQLNDSKPWLHPEVGREIIVPYNLRFVAGRGDTTESVAYRFLGRRNRAWMVATYNRLKRADLRQGEVILVPITDLALTPAGKESARNAGALIRSQGAGERLQAQQQAETEIPALVKDVDRGRYVDAVARGAGLLASSGLSEPQLATVYRQLTEAYVALGATGLAATSCNRWRLHEPDAVLDPIEISPKILNVCVGNSGREGSDNRPLPGMVAPPPVNDTPAANDSAAPASSAEAGP